VDAQSDISKIQISVMEEICDTDPPRAYVLNELFSQPVIYNGQIERGRGVLKLCPRHY
jgi:hypothetical protein